MNDLPLVPGPSCANCKDGSDSSLLFTMAFQPIVDTANQTVYAYEALVRGPQGESATSVLAQVNEQNRYAFDQGCRVKAIELAARLGLLQTGARLSVNFMPGAIYSPAACIRRTLQAAREYNIPLDRLIFELIEDERVKDTAHLMQIVLEYRKHGFALALDDFGAGYSGLNLLSELNTEVVKLDGHLTRNLHQNPIARTIIRAMVGLCAELGTTLIAEAVETNDEYSCLRECGITVMQGHLFAKPAFEALPPVVWPDVSLFSPEQRP